MIVFKTSQQPKKSAAKAKGRLLLLLFSLLYNCFLQVQNIICTYSVCLMEHIYFEAQLCINTSYFKENYNNHIVINLCLGTSLLLPLHSTPGNNTLVSPQKFLVFLHVFEWKITKYGQQWIFSNLACPKNPEIHIFQEKSACGMYHRQKIAFKYIPTQFPHENHTFYMKSTHNR